MRYFKDWQILRRSDFAIIGVITAIFLMVIVLNDRLIFRITTNQTEEIGQMQLEVIRSDFQGTLQAAESATLRMAMEAEQLMKAGTSQSDLEQFFYKRKREQKNSTNGVCFNAYIANKSFSIIPDFDMPPEYHATERLWYKGAVENPGKIFITEPYIDAMTGMMCYTMSKMLSDNQTVVSLDFNFSEVQYLIHRMSELGNRKSLIVTKTGMIIGYSDMNLVGEKISDTLPEYESILNHVIQSEHHESFTAQIDGSEHTVFSSETANGWYMILSVDNWAFYKDSYIQILVTTLLSLVMMLAIIIFYLNAMRNGLRAERALQVKEEFLSRLSHELRDPLHNILDLSSTRTVESNANPAECAAKVRESALKLSDMLDNLFSFSTIVSDDKNKSATKKFRNDELSKVSRYARIGVVTVLIAAMIVAFGICINTTTSWGDTKMNREVDNYENQLANWIENQQAILSMFVNTLREHPEFMDDYPKAVKFLDDLAKHYPEISVCYLANPYKEHNVIMNNGWESDDPNWHVDKRPWYIETENSATGFSVSAPYYDAQTGFYCVTMAQQIFNDKNEFIGIFAIDFYIDRLIQVLGKSYSQDSYAFLVDRNGIFTVVVANSWWNIYGNIILLGVFFIILLGICVLIVHLLINRLLKWQDSVNSQLKAASDTALAASKAKSQFLAQMSHEIRTPINAVLGMNEMILRESKTEAILDYAANIQSAGRTLLTLINSILDFSKIEDGKMEIVPVRYETLKLIDDLVNMTLERAKKKGLAFKTQIDSNLPRSLYGDDVRLRQVITNILTNAVKYTHEGSVTLSISGVEVDADTLKMRIKVTDTGIGIHAEDIDKLFLSFQRLDEEKNRNIEGTGLGISIVQKLLDMMDSKLEVESVYGQGGIELAKKKIYDIIFLDNMMPGMSGVETLKKMQRDKVLTGKTKVIMLTASAIAGMRETYLREGFDDYLSKPIDVSELEKVLAKYLPAELLSYVDEDAPQVVETVKEEEIEPETDSDTFSAAEKKKFAEQCPDINLETGLKYCMDSKSFTIQMLTTFTDGKKADKIQQKYDSGDWKGYQILVHALKSTSLSIGAEDLSEAAKKLEMAAKDGEVEEIKANHAALMDYYAKVRAEIEEWLNT